MRFLRRDHTETAKSSREPNYSVRLPFVSLRGLNPSPFSVSRYPAGGIPPAGYTANRLNVGRWSRFAANISFTIVRISSRESTADVSGS